jgi:hypothetical protein
MSAGQHMERAHFLRILPLVMCSFVFVPTLHAQAQKTASESAAKTGVFEKNILKVPVNTGVSGEATSAASPPTYAPSSAPALRSLRGKLFMTDTERAAIASARSRNSNNVASPVSPPANAEANSEDDDIAASTPKRLATTNGFLKRDDGSVIVWVNGQRRTLGKGNPNAAMSPSLIGGSPRVQLKPSSPLSSSSANAAVADGK